MTAATETETRTARIWRLILLSDELEAGQTMRGRWISDDWRARKDALIDAFEACPVEEQEAAIWQ